MKWDEDKFGLEYDLGIYNIVAVDDFNMGAMENKGLNVFNTAYVLADPATATDGDYERVEAVIGHEYFHNWTGNRVTCRDWFQLTNVRLEGLCRLTDCFGCFFLELEHSFGLAVFWDLTSDASCGGWFIWSVCCCCCSCSCEC